MHGVTHIVSNLGADNTIQSGQPKIGFTSGTYIGLGGATAPMLHTGLTKVSHVFMSPCYEGRNNATTAACMCRPCRAAGTPDGFYPLVFKPIGTAAITQNGIIAAATFKWLAMGILRTPG
jgi:hypothetical protein